MKIVRAPLSVRRGVYARPLMVNAWRIGTETVLALRDVPCGEHAQRSRGSAWRTTIKIVVNLMSVVIIKRVSLSMENVYVNNARRITGYDKVDRSYGLICFFFNLTLTRVSLRGCHPSENNLLDL